MEISAQRGWARLRKCCSEIHSLLQESISTHGPGYCRRGPSSAGIFSVFAQASRSPCRVHGCMVACMTDSQW